MSPVERLIRTGYKGKRGSRRGKKGQRLPITAHIRRGEELVTLIAARWEVEEPAQWRLKHVQWVLKHGLADRAPATRYCYWCTARLIMATLGRFEDWKPRLGGPWQTPKGQVPDPGRHPGGRPPNLPRYRRR